MTLKEKIISCHGNLTCRSTANVLGVTYAYVYQIWFDYGKTIEPKNQHRTLKGYKSQWR